MILTNNHNSTYHIAANLVCRLKIMLLSKQNAVIINGNSTTAMCTTGAVHVYTLL